jgi:small subunit ribosomal protein S15
MHSRKRGKSGSKRPLKSVSATWIRYKPKEMELMILKLAKEGKTSSQIGIILRDTYGVPDVKVITKKSIMATLKEKKVMPELPEDLSALIRKNVDILKHIEKNKMDQTAKRGLLLTESKIKRLVKYYKRSGRLSSDWKYDSKKASIFLE